MIASVLSATLLGVAGRPVRVEVHVSNGLPGFTIVGLPDAACRESRDRVRAALLSSGLPWPLKRVTVNLAPSGLRKAGSGLDLAMAVGLMAAVGEVPAESVRGLAFFGELGLDGSVRHLPGVVSLVDAVTAPTVVVGVASASEAELVVGRLVRPVGSLRQVIDALARRTAWPSPPARRPRSDPAIDAPDLADVRGQALGRWALEVAAAGSHHLLMVGSPGSGKTMLAERLPGLLPPLTQLQAMETTRVHSAAGRDVTIGGLQVRPPFRSPHHTSSTVSLIGGGSGRMRPGEVSLAHNGVLFLDEMGEFPAAVLDALRQPLEEGTVMVCRASSTVAFPARFLLVGALNPCPCGLGGTPGRCRCTPTARARYRRRLSGPLLDRFDLRVQVNKLAAAELMGSESGETSLVVAARVAEARSLAAERGVVANSMIPGPKLDELAPLTSTATRWLERRLQSGELSARGLHRVRRVARTIADLSGGPALVEEDHVVAAAALRAGDGHLSDAA